MQAKVKAKSALQPLVVTANRLRDGRVVWLAPAGRWSESIADAAVYLGDAADAGMAIAVKAEVEQLVVGSYVVEVATTAAGPAPLRAREKYRVSGPTVAAGIDPSLPVPIAA